MTTFAPRRRASSSYRVRPCYASRPGGLVAGSPPIVTDAHHLQAGVIVHVTGPQLRRGATPTAEERRLLAHAYSSSLDAAAAVGARTIAFPCLSTGQFCFPNADAASVALGTVTDWLSNTLRQHALDAVVFPVYTDADQAAYEALLPRLPDRVSVLLASDGCRVSSHSLFGETLSSGNDNGISHSRGDCRVSRTACRCDRDAHQRHAAKQRSPQRRRL